MLSDKAKKTLFILTIIVIIIIAFTLLILPSDYFDKGQSVCLSVLLAKKQCYACGMTRAFQHLIHFEFEKAWAYNKLIFIVFPLLIWVCFDKLYKDWKTLYRS